MVETLVLERWEWEQAPRECLLAIKESMKKKGYDAVEIWANTTKENVHVVYCYPPINHPHALYRGRT